MRGSPSPCSWRSRPGSSTDGSGSTSSGEKPPGVVGDGDDHRAVVELDADRHRGVGADGALRVDGVGARLGHREAQVVDAAVGELVAGGRGGGHDAAHEGEVVVAGRDLQVDRAPHAASAPPARSRASSTVAASGSAWSREVSSRTFRRLRRVDTSRRSPPWLRVRFSSPTITPSPVESTKSTACEVEDDPRLTADDDLHDPLPQPGRGGEVEVAGHPSHRPAVALLHLHDQVHRPNLPPVADDIAGTTALSSGERIGVRSSPRHGRPPGSARRPRGGDHRRPARRPGHRARSGPPRRRRRGHRPRARAGSSTSPPSRAAPARHAELTRPLPDAIAERLPGPLWTHQVEAIELARAGHSVVVASGTSSGKSLCYQVPIAEAASDPIRPGTALALFPTKALAHDQLRALTALELPGVVAGAYDGDASPEERTWVRKHASVVLTNPEMLHSGLLPHHERWATFLGGCASSCSTSCTPSAGSSAATSRSSPVGCGGSPSTTAPIRCSSARRPRSARRSGWRPRSAAPTWCPCSTTARRAVRAPSRCGSRRCSTCTPARAARRTARRPR